MDRAVELELVRRLREGDAEAFDVVHEAFNVRLFNFLARISNRRDVAEDLLEEVWMRLVSHAHRLRPDTQIGPWLYTVARHLHTSYRRSRQIEDGHAAGLVGLWPSGSPVRSPLEVAEASEARRRVATALAALPLQAREVLVLVEVEGLRPSEAAAVCGISAEALRQRLSRARVLLARQLTASEPLRQGSLREVTT